MTLGVGEIISIQGQSEGILIKSNGDKIFPVDGVKVYENSHIS